MNNQERVGNQNRELNPQHDTFVKLWRLRDTYHDEIPSERVHSARRDNRYKVRRGWFQGVVAHLNNGIYLYNVITDPDIIAEANEFCKWASTELADAENDRMVKADEVARGNAIINRVLTKYRPEYAITRYQDYTIYKQT